MEIGSSLLDVEVPDLVSSEELDRVTAAEVDLAAGRTAGWSASNAAPALRARALAVAGDGAAARRALAGIDAESVMSGDDLQALTSACWAASRVGGSRQLVHAIRTRLDAMDVHDRLVVDRGVVLGPGSLFAGLCDATVGEHDSAVAHLRRAVRIGDERAPYWGAWSRLELARELAGALDVTAPDDAERASITGERDALLSSATLFFGSAGHRHMASRCDELRSPSADGDLAAPGLGHLVQDSAPHSTDGTWLVGIATEPPVEIPATRGLEAVRYLIRHRDRVVPAVELASHLDGDGVWTGTVERLRDDPEALAAAVHDGRARTRVSKLLQRTIDGLSAPHASLSRHLADRVRTGYVCSYEDPVTRWRT